MLGRGHGGLYKAPTNGRRKNAKSLEEGGIRSSLLILDLKDGRQAVRFRMAKRRQGVP